VGFARFHLQDRLVLTTSHLEYWLSSLKIVTIIVFILVGILVNAGVNTDHHFIGFDNWRIEGAPFVGGFTGFATVFVTASFACAFRHSLMPTSFTDPAADGGTESLGITAGETANPSRSLPRVVKMVFFRFVVRLIPLVLTPNSETV